MLILGRQEDAPPKERLIDNFDKQKGNHSHEAHEDKKVWNM